MQHQQPNNFLEHGLRYAALGWHVFPIIPLSKQPIIKGWPQKATTDQALIRKWWTKWPGANVAIATGEQSKIVVIDLDIAKGGCNTLKKLERRYGKMPFTPLSITGTGGRHLIFAYPNNITIRNSSGRIGAGVDVRGLNGYIIAPPSIHPNGWQYLWKDGSSPWLTKPSNLPGWLLHLLRKPKKQRSYSNHTNHTNPYRPDPCTHWLREALYLVNTVGQGRNHSGFWMACQLRDDGISIKRAIKVMKIFVRRIPKKDHPYTIEEAIATLQSAYSQTPRNPAGVS